MVVEAWNALLRRASIFLRQYLRTFPAVFWRWLSTNHAAITALSTLSLFLLGLYLVRVQRSVFDLQEKELQYRIDTLEAERRASITTAFGSVTILEMRQEGPGVYRAFLPVILKNTTTNTAHNFHFQGQHWNGSDWLSVVIGRSIGDLGPRGQLELTLSSDTTGNPYAALAAGTRFYFAIRTTWTNPPGTDGCDLAFVEYYRQPAAYLGGTQLLIYPKRRADLPEGARKRLDLSCPREP